MRKVVQQHRRLKEVKKVVKRLSKNTLVTSLMKRK